MFGGSGCHEMREGARVQGGPVLEMILVVGLSVVGVGLVASFIHSFIHFELWGSEDDEDGDNDDQEEDDQTGNKSRGPGHAMVHRILEQVHLRYQSTFFLPVGTGCE